MQRIDKMVEALRNMDSVMRMANDQQRGPFMDWIELHLPDGATDQDIRDYVTAPDGQQFYLQCCQFFARRIADMLVHGQWSRDGYTMQLFNSQKYERQSTFDNVRVNVKVLAKYIADSQISLLQQHAQSLTQSQKCEIYQQAQQALRKTWNSR